MKLFVVLVLVGVATVFATPIPDDSQTTVLKYENDNIGVDGYKFAYETSDGVSRQEEASLKDIGGEEPALSVRGSVSWVAADGQTYTLNYIADENGYQPEAEHIPKA